MDLLCFLLAVSCVGTTVEYCRLSPCPKYGGGLIHETVCAAYFCMKIGPHLINHCLTQAAGYSWAPFIPSCLICAMKKHAVKNTNKRFRR